jgi:long-chain acyl-CoA synthetase
MATDTIASRLFAQARALADNPAYYVRSDSGWEPTNWRNFAAQVRVAARALVALGLQPGQKTAILGFNRPEWVIFNLGSLAAGAAPAGIYTTCSPNEVQYIIEHSESEIVLVENNDQWQKINQERERLPGVKHVVIMEGGEAIDDPLVMSWDDFMAKADTVPDSTVDDRLENLEKDAPATLIYTSGTTGPPKAVMLSHQNLVWTASIARELVGSNSTDTSLSYLPLSHIAEQMFTIHGPIMAGSAVYYAESIEKVPDNLKEVQPTIVFAVPRIWEKFYAGVNAKLALATGIKAKLVAWAMGVGQKVYPIRNAGKEPSGLLAMQYKLAKKLIYSKLATALGLGSARVLVSGAAPISQEILEFFGSLDLTIREVYGQSEDCGPTSFNVQGRTKFGSVGPAIPGVEVRIADDGEICVRGPNVFLGYYKDQAATDEALIDGWLHSGDLGAFDDEGFLSITGRKKDIIITAGGKNIAPKNIEAALKNSELVGEAVVIGDRRKFLSALLCLDPDAIERFASTHDIDVTKAHDDALVNSAIQTAVDSVNEKFARVEHIRKFHILHRQLTIEDGELTPTLKVKRNKVNEHFSDEIEGMYAE